MPDLPTRRAVLIGACSALVAGLGPALLAEGAQAATGVRINASGQAVITLRKVPALANVGGMVALGSIKGVPTAVVRTGATTYAALDLRCTHQGFTVLAGGGSWACPAHGSTFAADGAVTGGPAARSLAVVPSKLAKGVLTVG
jgi:Rieske Fe-S protein